MPWGPHHSRRPQRTVVIGPATQYVVTSSSYTPTAGSGVTITAQLADANNHAVKTAGKIVTWSKSDTGGSFGAPTSTTDANGVATVTFTTGTVDVNVTVTATDNSTPTPLTGTSATIAVTGGTIVPDAVMTSILNGLLNGGEIDFYTGAPPRSTANGAGATLLATLTFATPAGTNPPDMIANNKMNLHVTGTAFVIVDGFVGWARVRKPDGTAIYDGLVGLAGSGNPFIVSTASLSWTTGQTVTETSLTATTGT